MSHLNPLATPFLPAITSLPSLDDAALASTLDLLFEPSAELHALALPTMRTISFESYADLISTLREQLLAVAESVANPTPLSEVPPSIEQADGKAGDGEVPGIKELHTILGSHPRLGEKKTATLSAQSKEEQKQLQGGAEDEADRLAALNREYEEKFPGLRYVVFVNGRGRDVIMEDMRRRIDRGDVRAEEREAIEAMCAIAKDRATKLLAAAPAASVDG